MTTFISIILLIFCILQIILFFKVWRMTNDVKKIKNKLYEDDFPAKDLYEKTDFVKNIFYTNIQKNRQTYLLRRKRQGKENTSFNVWSIKRSV